VLNDRLRELRETAIVTTEPAGGYQLSDEGRRLLDALEPLSAWARRPSKR
jgi:DNA-binding HxlR family transcriptional regulator